MLKIVWNNFSTVYPSFFTFCCFQLVILSISQLCLFTQSSLLYGQASRAISIS